MNYTTLKLAQLKEIAAERGISPAGDKRKRQTWIDALVETAIENIEQEMDRYFDADIAKAEVAVAPAPSPKRYTLKTANAEIAGFGMEIRKNNTVAADKTNSRRKGWYELWIEGKRSAYKDSILKNLVERAHSIEEHDAQTLLWIAENEKLWRASTEKVS